MRLGGYEGWGSMRRFLRAFLGTVLALSLIPAAGADDHETFRECGAIALDERPPLGQKGSYDVRPYQRRHNRYLEHHPQVFASGYLSGDHFYIGLTHRVCMHLKKFKAPLDKPWRVRAFKADWTYRELRRAHNCVRDLNWDRLGIQGAGVDVYRNKDSVMFKNDKPWRRRAVLRRCGTVDFRFTEGTISPA